MQRSQERRQLSAVQPRTILATVEVQPGVERLVVLPALLVGGSGVGSVSVLQQLQCLVKNDLLLSVAASYFSQRGLDACERTRMRRHGCLAV